MEINYKFLCSRLNTFKLLMFNCAAPPSPLTRIAICKGPMRKHPAPPPLDLEGLILSNKLFLYIKILAEEHPQGTQYSTSPFF